MTTPLLKPKYPPYVTPSELAVMLDQAGGGGTAWTTASVRSTLAQAGALIPLPAAHRSTTPTTRRGKGQRFATTYDLLLKHLPDIHRSLILAASTDDLSRLLAEVQ